MSKYIRVKTPYPCSCERPTNSHLFRVHLSPENGYAVPKCDVCGGLPDPDRDLGPVEDGAPNGAPEGRYSVYKG